MPKKTQTKTVKKRTRTRKKTWTEEDKQIKLLLENELSGVLKYLHSLNIIAVLLLVSSAGGFLYAIQMLFEDRERAVIAFLLVAVATFISIIYSSLALKPWPLPRFLLPIDLSTISLNDLKELHRDPNEYIHSLAEHIHVLTEKYLLPKLHRLRNAITIILFGLATAIILAISLP